MTEQARKLVRARHKKSEELEHCCQKHLDHVRKFDGVEFRIAPGTDESFDVECQFCGKVRENVRYVRIAGGAPVPFSSIDLDEGSLS